MVNNEPVESPLERLWHRINEVRLDVEVATRHAEEDGVLRADDYAALAHITALRSEYTAAIDIRTLERDDGFFLADLDAWITSVEGRREILLLAVS